MTQLHGDAVGKACPEDPGLLVVDAKGIDAILACAEADDNYDYVDDEPNDVDEELEEEVQNNLEKTGLWAWLTGQVNASPPKPPSMVRILHLAEATDAAPARQGEIRHVDSFLFEAYVEVEVEAPGEDNGTHFVLSVFSVSTSNEVDSPESFVHHFTSKEPIASRMIAKIPGLKPNSMYEIDVRVTSNVGLSSEGVQVHILTPESPSQDPAKQVESDEEFHDLPPCPAFHHSPALLTSGADGSDDEGLWHECEEEAFERQHSQRAKSEAAVPKGDEAALPPGRHWSAGFQIEERQLFFACSHAAENLGIDFNACRQGTGSRRSGQWKRVCAEGVNLLEAAVDAIQSACPGCSRQQALRLALGVDLDANFAAEKWRQVAQWRAEHMLDSVKSRVSTMQHDRASGHKVVFPHHDEVCSSFCVVSPCALVTSDGHPVTVWHIGTMNVDQVESLPVETLLRWSRSVFEYINVWLAEESERTGRLQGHIHVFDLEGLSWWHLMSGELLEKGRAALGAGEFYVECCYDVYAINASTIFNAVWRLVRQFLSARVASKIVVDSGVPSSLLEALGPQGPQRMKAVLRSPKSGAASAPVLRPPNRGGRSSLL